jgi:hypothetical protein
MQKKLSVFGGLFYVVLYLIGRSGCLLKTGGKTDRIRENMVYKPLFSVFAYNFSCP